MPGEEPPQPADARADTLLGQDITHLVQEGLRLLPIDLKDPLSVRFDGRCGSLPARRPGRDRALRLEAFVLADRAGWADPEALGRLSARSSRLDRRDHAFSQIHR